MVHGEAVADQGGEAVADQGGEAVADQGGDSSASVEFLSEAVLMKLKQSMSRTSGNDADDEASSSSSIKSYDSRDYSNGSTPPPSCDGGTPVEITPPSAPPSGTCPALSPASELPGVPEVSEDDLLENLFQPKDLTQ